MSYNTNLGAPHRQELLNLINHDNAATIGDPLKVEGYGLSENTLLESGSYSAKVTNKSYTADTVVVEYTKLALGDFVTMTVDGGDFDWYTPDDWDDATSIPAAIAAFKAAAVRDGINPDAAFDSITVSRAFSEVANRFIMTVTVESFVWKETVAFEMPKHFSEVIEVTDLAGFVFSPIAVEAVVE